MSKPSASPPAPVAFGTDEIEATMSAVLSLFERWALVEADARKLLGGPTTEIYAQWRAGKVDDVPQITQLRIYDLLGIEDALRSLFSQPDRAYQWVRRPNSNFGGRSALDRMLDGAPGDIADVRRYLDAETRGPW